MAAMAICSFRQFPVEIGVRGCGGEVAEGGRRAADRRKAAAEQGRRQQQRRELEKDRDEIAGVSAQAVIAGLAASLEHLVDSAGPQRYACSRFHAYEAPPIGVFDYVVRLRKYYRCSLECFVLALVYMLRVTERHSEVQVGELSCHRLLAASLTLAVKFHDDSAGSSRFYAGICGLPARELGTLEREMLGLLGGELMVQSEEFDACLTSLRRAGCAYFA
mmetsp:Transcript_115616/g.334015  ORF Transcript_115616/g.334015 Transcript_115616/m.334015 type:complete len:219 (+) Transcript_115616:47-703(+)